MSRRTAFTAAFLTVTAVALGLEMWAAFDGNPDTPPWTDLIVTYVPGEVTLAAIGALVLWLPIHFAIRYRRKQRSKESNDHRKDRV